MGQQGGAYSIQIDGVRLVVRLSQVKIVFSKASGRVMKWLLLETSEYGMGLTFLEQRAVWSSKKGIVGE